MNVPNTVLASVEAVRLQVAALQVTLDGLRAEAGALAERRQQFVADMARIRQLTAEIESAAVADHERLADGFGALVVDLGAAARRLSEEVFAFQEALRLHGDSPGATQAMAEADLPLLRSGAIKLALLRMEQGPASTANLLRRP